MLNKYLLPKPNEHKVVVNEVTESDLQIWNLDYQIYERYLEKLQKHLYYFWHFAKQFDIPATQYYNHDLSKWSSSEFPHYARYFCNGKQEKDKPAFAKGWLHHIHNNPHHHEYWYFNEDYNFGGAVNGCLPMDKIYIKEMVVDWLAASYQYTGSIDMTEWLDKNLPRIRLHPESRIILKSFLRELGYKELI